MDTLCIPRMVRVESEADIRDLLLKLVPRQGFRVEFRANSTGAEALTRVSELVAHGLLDVANRLELFAALALYSEAMVGVGAANYRGAVLDVTLGNSFRQPGASQTVAKYIWQGVARIGLMRDDDLVVRESLVIEGRARNVDHHPSLEVRTEREGATTHLLVDGVRTAAFNDGFVRYSRVMECVIRLPDVPGRRKGHGGLLADGTLADDSRFYLAGNFDVLVTQENEHEPVVVEIFLV